MAPTSDAKGSMAKPGGKQYLIVGGVTLGGALLYFWWKNRKAAPAAAADSTGTSAPSTPTGLSTAEFWAWIQDHTTSTTKTTGGGGGPGPKPKPKPGTKVTVPDVVGREYHDAAIMLKEAGLQAHRAEPDVGKVTAEVPKAGRKVPHGSAVVLSGKGGGKLIHEGT